jgi:Domain of unknown function (DUF4294)
MILLRRDMLKWLPIVLCLCLPYHSLAQAKNIPAYQYDSKSIVAETDSIMHLVLPEILVYPEHKNWSPKAWHQYSILELRVLKVYPIAKMAAIKLKEYNEAYVGFKTERERKNYIKKIEKDLFAEFEPEMRSMSISTGRILIKLIDRQTGKSSFEIIKEFKGGFSAFFWQGVARIFGHNLKSEFDAEHEDQLINYIVWQIDNGLL